MTLANKRAIFMHFCVIKRKADKKLAYIEKKQYLCTRKGSSEIEPLYTKRWIGVF